MTGRHAAPRDEAFDLQERDSAGSHRADAPEPFDPADVPVTATAKRPAAKMAAKTPRAKKASKEAT